MSSLMWALDTISLNNSTVREGCQLDQDTFIPNIKIPDSLEDTIM